MFDMDRTRLINIILLLFSKNPEVVLHMPHKYEDRRKPTIQYLCLKMMPIYDLRPEEIDWLIEEEIIDMHTGENNDPELTYNLYVYFMTDYAKLKLKKIIKDIIEKRKKIE